MLLVQALKAGETGDEDIIRLAAEDAELARAKERLTLKHRNSSRWARRALKRGMDVMDEGTKAAVAEQLRLGEELRRKVCCIILCYFAFPSRPCHLTLPNCPCQVPLSSGNVSCVSPIITCWYLLAFAPCSLPLSPALNLFSWQMTAVTAKQIRSGLRVCIAAQI